jgi:hypothetical protein
MLDGIKRLFSRAPAAAQGWDELVTWAGTRQHVFRPVHESEGFIVEGRLGALPWRMEWGPSQRPYVSGKELRLRAELGLSSEVQTLVLDRELQVAMERTVFEQYVEGVQTRIDNQTPPEMRWLVMFPKLGDHEMGALHEKFVAVAPTRTWLQHWLAGPLTAALLAAPRETGQPLVLMISRGRLTLRTALADPSPALLDRWLRLFHAALREARRVAEHGSDAAAGGASTQPSLWSPTRSPDDGAPPA